MKFAEDAPAIAPRPEVATTSPVYHGAFDYVELEQLGLNPDEVLDFSVNSNPYGPSPEVQRALTHIPLDRYPDREALDLRRALAGQNHVSTDQIVVGNGTAELLWLVALAFLRAGDQVLVVGPTFGEYGRVAALMGAHLETWTARPEREFAVEPEAVGRCLQRLAPRLAFASGLHSALTANADNILVLRSMTKDYALAGLRLGYAMGHASLVAALGRVRPAWNVNALAQAAGVAALGGEVRLRATLDALSLAKEDLVTALSALGLSPLPSAVHFFLVDVGDGGAFRQKLLREGILVRNCASFGLPKYVRIATRRPEENARLVAAISALNKQRRSSVNGE
jgi:histidinol-phosphate/aromatic aminotransferase/cobyric acid decarboxylase-like protein